MHTSDLTSTDFRLLGGKEIAAPEEFRKELGIDDQTMLFLTVVGGELRIKPIHFKKNPSE